MRRPVCTYLLEWIETCQDDFEGSGLEVLAEKIREGASRILIDTMNGDVKSSQVQKVRGEYTWQQHISSVRFYVHLTPIMTLIC